MRDSGPGAGASRASGGSRRASSAPGSSAARDPHAHRLAEALGRLGAAIEDPGTSLVVAFSGGLDSCVLLHLLRFAIRPEARLVAAHFDHGMRSGSAADAAWARGVCAAWGVACVVERAEPAPTSEAGARDARYGFLERVRTRHGPGLVLTAHHADDQAETVLFRILRGTGLEGLRGIPAAREPGVVRPLLGFWREDLEAYAGAVGLRWREDPTNEQLGYARNVLRHQIIPAAEARVSSGARRALVRLAGVAEREEEAWAEILPDVLADLDASAGRGPSPASGRWGAPAASETPTAPEPVHPRGAVALSLDRDATAALGPALRGRVLRWAAARCGRTLDEATTARAVDFAVTAESGGRLELGAGIELRRELDRLEVTGPTAPPADEPLRIEEPRSGEGRALLGGRPVTASWRVGEHDAGGEGAGTQASFRIADLAFPLTLRGRRAGDRITLPGGTSKVKKVLLAARIPPGTRGTVPLLVDAAGRVLWVAGVARSSAVPESEKATGEDALTIRIGT